MSGFTWQHPQVRTQCRPDLGFLPPVRDRSISGPGPPREGHLGARSEASRQPGSQRHAQAGQAADAGERLAGATG